MVLYNYGAIIRNNVIHHLSYQIQLSSDCWSNGLVLSLSVTGYELRVIHSRVQFAVF